MAVAWEFRPVTCEMFGGPRARMFSPSCRSARYSPVEDVIGELIESIFHQSMPQRQFANCQHRCNSTSRYRGQGFPRQQRGACFKATSVKSNDIKQQENLPKDTDNSEQSKDNLNQEFQCKNERMNHEENSEAREESPAFISFLEPFLAEMQHNLFRHILNNCESSSGPDHQQDSAVSLPVQKEKEKNILNFDMGKCDPNTIEIKVEDNILKVKGKKESEDGVMLMSYEKSLPQGVSSETLSASLSPRGILKIREGEEPTPVPITRNGSELKQTEQENENQDDSPSLN